jgi:hypothetical protein
MLHVRRRPPLSAAEAIDHRQKLGGVLESVLELLFDNHNTIPHDRDRSDPAGGFDGKGAGHEAGVVNCYSLLVICYLQTIDEPVTASKQQVTSNE